MFRPAKVWGALCQSAALMSRSVQLQVIRLQASDAGVGSVTTSDAGRLSLASSDGGATTSAGSDAGTDVGNAGTGTAGVADASSADDGGQACTVGATCPAGTSCVTGACRPCDAGVCVCQRDDDCPARQICDHAAGTCTQPPPACTSLTTEADCTARADCTPIYGGMSCTNSMGSSCQSGEANCTCATYSFAACVARSP
jgi:hypothetical protein